MEADATQKQVEIEEYTQLQTEIEVRELEARRKEKPLQELKRQNEHAIAGLQQQNSAAQDALHAAIAEKTKLGAKRNKYTDKILGMEKELRECVADAAAIDDAMEAALTATKELAAQLELSPDAMEVTGTSALLDRKIAAKEKRIKKSEDQHGASHEQIEAVYTRAQQTYDEYVVASEGPAAFMKALQRGAGGRTANLTKLITAIGNRAEYCFKKTIKKKNWKGQMKVDHATGLLDIHVDPTGVSSSNREGDGAKTNAGLSGGEKSYTTSCFIVSLWEAMETPFRCLDEFDVFMDNLNRKIAIDMMIDVAKSQEGRQFVYLSPLGMSFLKEYDSDDRVNVIRMADHTTQSTLDGFLQNT